MTDATHELVELVREIAIGGLRNELIFLPKMRALLERINADPFSGASKEALALRYVMDALWEHDKGRDRQHGFAFSFCERCEAEGGSPDPHAHWSDVPHEKDCLYAIAQAAMLPATTDAK